jgi:hypothetical protein
MSNAVETASQAHQRRAGIAGGIDFTMMYIAHDAFNRDLDRLLAAADADRAQSPAAVATWQSFSRQLHTPRSRGRLPLAPSSPGGLGPCREPDPRRHGTRAHVP